MTHSLNFVVLTAGSESAQELRSALSGDRRARLLMVSDQAEQVYSEVVRSRPSAAIIALGPQPEAAWALCRRIRAASPETAVICASRNPTPDLILDSLRAGASEFLRLPVNPDEFKTVFARTAELKTSELGGAKKRGRVVSVFSTKGGCGVSFIAANLAVAIGAPTALVDLNLQAGDLDVFFGIKPRFSIADLVENRARLDDGLIAGYMAPHSTQLSLLPAPRTAGAAENIRPEHLVEVAEALRDRHEFVVFDLPHTFDALTLAALDQADYILLVSALDLLSARGAQRALSIFDRLGYPRQKVRLVINRMDKQRDLESQHVERYLDERIACFITNDPASAMNSINQGQPIAESSSSSPIVAEMKRLAAICGAAVEEETPRKGGLSSFFRRQTAPLAAGFPVLSGKPVVGD